MSFREQATADLATFLNVDEFGDTIEVDGVAVACVLVDDETNSDNEGVFLLESTLYVRASDLAALPVVRQRMTVGARQGDVVRVDEDQGMLGIHLRWFDS